MAHVDQEEQIRNDLTAHRDRVTALVDRLDQNLSCAELLSEVRDCHRALGQLCATLAIEHCRHHIAEEMDPDNRQRAADEVAAVLQGAFQ